MDFDCFDFDLDFDFDFDLDFFTLFNFKILGFRLDRERERELFIFLVFRLLAFPFLDRLDRLDRLDILKIQKQKKLFTFIYLYICPTVGINSFIHSDTDTDDVRFMYKFMQDPKNADHEMITKIMTAHKNETGSRLASNCCSG